MPDEAIVNSLARYLVTSKFQIPIAIQKIMEYSFWMKSINSSEDIERLYPINKEHIDSNVFTNHILLGKTNICPCNRKTK
jgi:hypothetical protein